MAEHGSAFNRANKNLSLDLQENADLAERIETADIAQLKKDYSKLQADVTTLEEKVEALETAQTDFGKVVRYLYEWKNNGPQGSVNLNWPDGLDKYL
jgi:uncharacterized protein YlxW (UPF0749 family)